MHAKDTDGTRHQFSDHSRYALDTNSDRNAQTHLTARTNERPPVYPYAFDQVYTASIVMALTTETFLWNAAKAKWNHKQKRLLHSHPITATPHLSWAVDSLLVLFITQKWTREKKGQHFYWKRKPQRNVLCQTIPQSQIPCLHSSTTYHENSYPQTWEFAYEPHLLVSPWIFLSGLLWTFAAKANSWWPARSTVGGTLDKW